MSSVRPETGLAVGMGLLVSAVEGRSVHVDRRGVGILRQDRTVFARMDAGVSLGMPHRNV